MLKCNFLCIFHANRTQIRNVNNRHYKVKRTIKSDNLICIYRNC